MIRHCREFEPDWLTLLEELTHKPVKPLGPLTPSIQDNIIDEGNNETWNRIKSWLEHQKGKSVIYVAFGSEATLSQEELTELALGLELSGLPCFWVLRKPTVRPSRLPLLNFQTHLKRVRGRGIVWANWVPQLRMLSHDSVGGFFTHSGWSSVIEALQNGLPPVIFPLMVDQWPTARVLADKKVGIEISRDETDGVFDRSSVAELLHLIMVDEKGKCYREKAKEMMGIFRDTEGQKWYIQSLLENLEKNKPCAQGA